MIYIVYGTRAELIKFSPLIRELKRRKAGFRTVDIGQHDNRATRESLGLPRPDFHFGRSYRSSWSGLEASALTYPAASLLALVWGTKVFFKMARLVSRGDVVVTHGNTIGVPPVILAARIGGGRKVHMESGFRGGTRSSRLLDAIYKFADRNSDLLFTPYRSTESNLRKDGVSGKIVLTGDVMKDVVAAPAGRRAKVKIPKGRYVVANITRSIVDRSDARNILHALRDSPVNSVLIMNPVIARRVERFGLAGLLKSEKITTMGPLPHSDFLALLRRSSGALTDSTGVEEECAALGKPCIATTDFVQIRELESGGAVSRAGANYTAILSRLRKISGGRWKIKKGDVMGPGSPTRKIADHLIAFGGGKK